MRLSSDQNLLTHDGSVIICDAVCVPPRAFDVARFFEVAPREYGIYRVADIECLVVDLAPRTVRAGSRQDLERVGSVAIRSGSIAVFDPWAGPAGAAGETGYATRFGDAKLRVWLEKKDSSATLTASVLGIGPRVHLLLSGPDGDQVLALERRVASALRSKGAERESLIHELRRELLEIHAGGSKDGRLGVLAQALKLKFPRRPR